MSQSGDLQKLAAATAGGLGVDLVKVREIESELDRLRDIIARASRLCEGRDTAMVLQVLAEARPVSSGEGS